MKVVILAGGLGTRISEETENKPKPMVLLDDKPILWHVMNIFASQGHADFIIAAGYKGEVIHEWVNQLDTTWNIEVIDTGLTTQTGGRIKQCMQHISHETVMVTYGDGLANVNISKLIEAHKKSLLLATVTAVRPPARFGLLEIENGVVTHFGEKRQSDVGWINGGFFVLEPEVTSYIEADDEPFEMQPLTRIVEKNQLHAYLHQSFWQPMDTLREKNDLANLAKKLPPPWLVVEN